MPGKDTSAPSTPKSAGDRRNTARQSAEAAGEEQVSGAGQGIDRFNAILRALGSRGGQGLRLIDIAEMTGLSKSTCHRLLGSIVQTRLAEHDEDRGLYFLGLDIATLGMAAANRYGITNLAQKGMQRLVDQSGDTVFLSVRANLEATCVERLEGSYPVKVLTLSVGDRRPLGVGAGSLALLAFLPDRDVQSIIEATREMRAPYANFDTARIYELVEETRARKYSLNRGGIVREMCAVGVPIVDPEGLPVAAFSIAATENRIRGQRQDALVGWLQDEARIVEQRLGDLAQNVSPVKLRRLLSDSAPG